MRARDVLISRPDMPRPSTIVLGVLGAAFVTWLAGASSSTPPTIPPVAETQSMDGAQALLDEVARLHRRLDQIAPSSSPVRNPFRFNGGRHVVSAGPASVQADARSDDASARGVALRPVPELALIGMAEDSGTEAGAGEGPQRTAIISGGGELFFVRKGDQLGGKYTVAGVYGDAVELVSLSDAAVIRLQLK
jgi:hypothetical protein